MKLTFKISLSSDYHIGAGYGKGVVDSVILKDKNGRPIIRGTTLSGLIRQGMWELLQLDLLRQHRKCKQSGASGISYCPEATENSTCPVCRILGTPAYAKKWQIYSAEIEDSSVVRAEKIIWRNRVNPRTRTAEARKLFTEETASGKINFIFKVSNESNDVQTLEEASFIVAALRMVRSIGSSRRRGKGLCQIHLVDIIPEIENTKTASKEEKLLDIFRTKWLENKELNIPEKNVQIEPTGVKSPSKKSFNVILLAKEPLLIANRSESGNRFQTNDYIPGYTILGALAWKVANRYNLNNNKNVYEEFIDLFRRGKIKVSPLYPGWKIEDDFYPAVPSPHDLLTCKLYPEFEENGHGVKSFANDENEPKNCEKCLEIGIETPLEPLNKFLPLHKKLKTVDVAIREEMHITIDPETGRTKTGDLFSYTVIESGQYFIGTIDIDNWVDFVNLLGIYSQENISFELRVGKASSRGYGHAKIWLQPEENTENIFLGKPLEKRVKNLTEPLTMTLITDAIIVDRWGRFYSALDKEILSPLLGLEVEVINTYVKSRNVDGFNTYLGLLKYRDHAISAGSSVGFIIKTSVNSNELLKCLGKLEKEGIGLRREEGFGKISFNHPIYNKNEGVDVRVHLPDFMRIPKMNEEITNFERWWKHYLIENLHQKDFDHPEWIAVTRWLRENSKKPIKEIIELIKKFHSPEKLAELVKQRDAYRDKKKFLEDKGKKGFESLSDSFKKLSERLSTENETVRQYLQIKAIEMLADFVASLTEKKKND